MDEAVRELLAAVEPLLDPERVSPFMSAWEFDPHDMETDGEKMHARLNSAYEAVAVRASAAPSTL